MRATLLALCSICGIVGFADDAVSPAFTFDARYKSSDITPDAWVSYEAEGLSSRFSAATVTRAADANGNGIQDEWESAKGRVYSVYSTYSLSDGWRGEPDAEIPGTGETLQYVPPTPCPAMFFKVSVRLSE